VTELFIVACAPADSPDMAVLMEGMKAHSEADAFPVWCGDEIPVPQMVLDLLGLKDLHDTWGLVVPGQAELETFVQLMESVSWAAEVWIMDGTVFKKKWTSAGFHKAVMVDKEFA